MIVIVSALAFIVGCSRSPLDKESSRGVSATSTSSTASTSIHFKDIAAEAGLDFVHTSGLTSEKLFPTVLGSGAGIFDHDGDGLMDIYLVNATTFPLGSSSRASNRLFKNLGNGRFRDVTASSGLGFSGFCHGVTAADLDNDGDADVLLTGYRMRVLYRNEGNGRFVDVTRGSGVESDAWSTCSAALDYDNDGDLDLYVSNYGDWQYPRDNVFCGDPQRGYRIYCSPKSVEPARHSLLRNNGDGTFTDVAVASGLGRKDGRGLGVVAVDLNDDGKLDLYVANDMCPNFLYLNRGDGTFEDVTETAGASYGEEGRINAGMGVDSEDVDGDGRPDLFVTNYIQERDTLYRNLGDGTFLDDTSRVGLAAETSDWVGWGCLLADFDSDGRPDLLNVNGAVDDYTGRRGRRTYGEPPKLFRNVEGRKFQLATSEAGPYFAVEHEGRGVAVGDLDEDGDLDVVINDRGGPPALLRNETRAGNHWLRLKLVGTKSNRDAIGAKVEIEAGGRTITRRRKGGSSFASTHDPRLLIGLGKVDRASRVTVRWPSGLVSELVDLAVDQTFEVVEGETLPDLRKSRPGSDSQATTIRTGRR